jgi:DNA repair protein RecO (recombination protein O)
MNQLVTEGIILSRTDYGEADRILTLLTPDHGKLRLMAKGVRRVKSKLAGGIELFSISTITFVKGRGDIGTLVSTRLVKHYNHIVEDLDRTMLGYELIKQLNKATEDHPEPIYFDLLRHTFEALDDSRISLELVRFWFAARMLDVGGHAPNLVTDTTGQKLQPGTTYDFDAESMCFAGPRPRGRFTTNHIKFIRLAFSGSSPKALLNVHGSQALLKECGSLVTDLIMRT